jgi:hypothetical protein
MEPGKDEECNWIPAPTDEFTPAMRLYAPNNRWSVGALR